MALGAALALAVPIPARASLIVSEGFNYPGQADNAALGAAAFNGGTGLDTNWLGSGKYRSTGLTFSDLAVTGGCAQNSSSQIYYRKITVNQTGTLWGSFLFKSVGVVDTTTTLLSYVVNSNAGGGDYQGSTKFGVTPKRYQATAGDIRLGGDGSNPTAQNNVGGTSVTQGVTYLVLFKVENLIASGGTATSQTITSWILSAAQYDNFKSGGLTEAELNAATQGSIATNVTQRTTMTATKKASFSTNDYLTVQSNNAGDFMNDEFRFSDASLAEVAPAGTPKADMYAFGPGATIGPVVADAAPISWTVPYGANVASLAATYTLSAGATCVPASGSAQDFSSPVHYIVQASDFATSGKTTDYTATVDVTPASSAKDMLNFGPGAAITGTDIAWSVPFGTDVTALAPTYTVSTFATADLSFPSGAARNFTSPQTYTITAQDTTTQTYTATVTVAPDESTLLWNVAGGGTWDTTTYNWKGQVSGLTMPYFNGKNVIFDKTNGGTITLASGISPASTTVSAASGTYAFSGSLGGTGSLTKSNGGSLNLDGSNTYTGGTLISAGTVYCGLSNTSPLGGAGTINVTVESGATLSMDRNQITGNLTLNGGKVATSNGWGDDAWNGPVALSGISTIDVGGTDGSLLITGVVSGPGGLIKLGTSVRPTRLTGANTFTGTVSVQAGVMQATSLNRISGGTATSNLGAPATVANGTISLGAGGTGGTLSYDGPGETTDRVIKLAGTTGGATISQSGTGAGFPTTRGESGLLKFTSDVSSPGTAGVDNRKTLILTQVNSATTGTHPGRGEISGSIGDSVLGTVGQLATSVTKSSFSTWTLSGVNTYSGATKVQAGTLAFSRSNSLGSGSLDITAGAKVQLDYIGTRQISALTYDAGAAKPNGSYGSSRSLATFKDDTRFSGLGTVTIGAITGATTTTLARTSGNEPSNGGEPLTFTATVAGTSPTGNVMFYDGLTLIGTSALNGSFQATLTSSNLSAGSHVISALYVGSASNASSTGNLTQTVVETRTLATTTTLSSSANPSAYGASVTFTATVAGSTPAGSVMFYNGTNPLGTATLNGGGLASLAISNLASGWRPITARYLGDATHLPSATASALFQTVNPPAGNGKLKVFILAGQSNMVGKGQVEFGRDPNNAAVTNLVGGLGSLRNMLNRDPQKYGYLADPANPTAQGNPGFMKRSDVWVNYFGEPAVPRKGILDTNFGNTGGQGLIGPEYGFGLVTGSQLGDPVLLIKVAWGGKSLLVDFRPPGAVAKRGGVLGPYYTQMIDRVHYVLNNLATEFPGYTGGGYEIAGFGWHQGWNDQGQATSIYEDNLVDLIKDVRTEFGVPNMPVSIGITGMGNSACGTILQAQLNVGNPALHPEFAGTVVSVDTRPFDYGIQLGTSSEGFHWNWNGESYLNIGESMGLAMMSLLPPPVTLTPFESWAGNPAQGLTAGVNDDPMDDPDHDGIANLMEFALGDAPMISSQSKLPSQAPVTGGNWTFSYDRSVASRPPATTQIVEYGDDLSGWEPINIPLNGANNVAITNEGATDHVVVTLAPLGTKGFVRLKVSQ